MKYCVKIGNLYVNYICIGNQKITLTDKKTSAKGFRLKKHIRALMQEFGVKHYEIEEREEQL
ncbi:MAG: hypothetical protein M0P51_14475 [Methanoculleus sp.]|jgi:hypothetical protein|nr:hypothetical protein [Methanoculleus sp.]